MAGIFLVALVLAVEDGDRWRINIAGVWLLTSTVQVIRTLLSRRKRPHQGSDSRR